jgi:hypothetical protein
MEAWHACYQMWSKDQYRTFSFKKTLLKIMYIVKNTLIIRETGGFPISPYLEIFLFYTNERYAIMQWNRFDSCQSTVNRIWTNICSVAYQPTSSVHIHNINIKIISKTAIDISSYSLVPSVLLYSIFPWVFFSYYSCDDHMWPTIWWRSREAAGWGQHRTDRRGELWGRSMSSSGRLSADMMMMTTFVTIKHITGCNEWRRSFQCCENRNMRVKVWERLHRFPIIATCDIYLLILTSHNKN